MMVAAASPAERELSRRVREQVERYQGSTTPPVILNIGAGRSTIVEQRMHEAGLRFIADRVDVDDCRVEHEWVGKCWIDPVEKMADVASDR